ncbi:MAG: hypothetical protein K6F25_00020, partial [Bacteroidales bacterium]|nr:hypothetical protein [Bacteroidales bacterium]
MLTSLAVSCSGTAGTGMPEWRWPDPVTPDEVPYEDPNPDMVAAGWTNVREEFAALPGGICVYRSPQELAGVKAVAYAAIADPALIS